MTSFTAGFTEIGEPAESNLAVPTQSIGANGSTGTTYRISFTLPETDVTAMVKTKLTGTGASHVDGYWFPLQGRTLAAATSTGFIIAGIIMNRTSTLLTVNFEFINITGSSRTLPNITASARIRFHTYPW